MNYEGLKNAVADTLKRADLVSAAPTFIALAEARLNREMRVRQMLTRAVATVAGQYVELPDDWLEARNIQLNTDPVRPLEYVTLREADKIRAGSGTRPWAYTVSGAALEVIPVVSNGTEIEMSYYARLPPLEDNPDGNWLLDTWPDVYLYGALVHSAPYLMEDERIQVWASLYDRAMEEARIADQRAQYSGSPLKMRAAAFS